MEQQAAERRRSPRIQLPPFPDLVREGGRIINTVIAIDVIEIRSIGLFPN